jgi:hypothetical protein
MFHDRTQEEVRQRWPTRKLKAFAATDRGRGKKLGLSEDEVRCIPCAGPGVEPCMCWDGTVHSSVAGVVASTRPAAQLALWGDIGSAGALS